MKQRIQQRLELSFILKRREELRGHSAPRKPVRAGEPPRRGRLSAACRHRMAVHFLSQFPVRSRTGRERTLPSGSQAVCSSYSLHVYFPSRFELSQVSARGLASLSCANMNHSLAPASNRAAASPWDQPVRVPRSLSLDSQGLSSEDGVPAQLKSLLVCLQLRCSRFYSI